MASSFITIMSVVDEAVIDASPAMVFKAILDESAGVTHWWMPYLESKLIGDIPAGKEGATFDVTVHQQATPRFTWKVTKIVENQLIDMEYGGDFTGTGKWMLEPADGKTKVKFIWDTKPKRLLFIILSPVVDLGKGHSTVMKHGFKLLNSYLNKN